MKKRPPKNKQSSPPARKSISLAKDWRWDWWGAHWLNGIRSRPRATGHRKMRRYNTVELLRDPEPEAAKLMVAKWRRWKKVPGNSVAKAIAAKKQRQVTSFGLKIRGWAQPDVRIGRAFLGVVLALALAKPAVSQHADAAREVVLICLVQMDVTTTQDQCRTALLAPCVAEKVGSEAHFACLAGEREAWRGKMAAVRGDVEPRLTKAAAEELSVMLWQWVGHVSRNCTEVGLHRTGTRQEVAILGCEILEIAGLTLEFERCASGQSTAPYCVFQE